MSKVNISNVSEIIESLKEADETYFNGDGKEVMTDAEYDKLKKLAASLDPSNPYFTRIGSDVRGSKIRLPHVMGSLDQIYNNGYLPWATKYAKNSSTVIVSRKKDGISGMLEYRNGKFVIAYSRGNGVEGGDITRHANHVQSVVKTLNGEDYMAIRGEFIMKNSVHASKWTKYANPRVTVSGTMNRSESNKDILADIDFIAYEIVASNGRTFNTKKEQLEYLSSLGFKVVGYEEFDTFSLNEKMLEALLIDSRINSDYELDGLVITVNELDNVESKRSSLSLNPEHSCKFKVNSEADEVETIVTDVIWEVSKNGLYKPRVEIQPVKLFGTMVTYATGHNAKNIIDNGIGIGAKIKITKAGSVIPYITSVVTKSPKLTYPPTDYAWAWSSSGVEIVLEDIETHPIVRLKQSLDFMESLKVDLLKEASLNKMFIEYKLFDLNFHDTVMLLISLMEYEWIRVLGSNGSKIYASLQRRLQNMEMATFLGALPYFGAGFGLRKAKSLLEPLNNDEDVFKLDAATISTFSGFDGSAEQVANGLPDSKKLYDALIATNEVIFIKKVKTDELKGINVVMTGFRDALLAEEIEKRGGKNSSSVSKNTTYLLTYDTNSNSGKAKKAKELGVSVLTPDQFKDMFNL